MAEWQSKTNFQSDRSQAASLTAADFVINVLQLFVFRVWGGVVGKRERERELHLIAVAVSLSSLSVLRLSLSLSVLSS